MRERGELYVRERGGTLREGERGELYVNLHEGERGNFT